MAGIRGISPADQPAAPANSGIAVKLNDLDLSRASETTALVMSLFKGRGVEAKAKSNQTAVREATPSVPSIRPNQILGPTATRSGTPEVRWSDTGIRAATARRTAVEYMRANLKPAYCDGRLLLGHPKDLWGDDLQIGALRATSPSDDGWRLDFIVSPVDGVRTMLQGLDAGAISVLAGGPRGFLNHVKSTLASHEYFSVFALNPKLSELERAEEEKRSTDDAGDEHPRSEASENFQTSWLLQTGLLARARKRQCELTIGTMAQDQPAAVRNSISRFCRLHAFHGSSVAAATAVLLGRVGIDAFVAGVRKTHAVLIAIAAAATGARVSLVPAEKSKTGGGIETIPDAAIYDGSAIVKPSDDVFLVATGITENLLLKGVRFHGRRKATTHSLVLRALTRTERFIMTHHNLEHKQLPTPQGTMRFAEVATQLEKEVLYREKNATVKSR